MDPLTLSALIGAGGSLVSGGLNLFGQSQQQGNQQQTLQMAMQDYQLRKRMADQQYELATAGSQDARGNQTRYVPGRGWVTDVTPTTRSLISQSDAIAGSRGADELTRGSDERSRNYNRRITEGGAANPLLQAMMNGYGAPSKEGVVGADKIAGVTAANETADNTRGGFTSAALRTGMGSAPLGSTLQSLDKGATAGMRTALAKSDAGGGALYSQMMQDFNKSKLDPYNMLATRASNPEGSGFQPENVSGGLDTALLNRSATASRGMGGAGFNGTVSPLLAAMMAQKSLNYDAFGAGLTANLKELAQSFGGNKGNGIPWPEDSRNPDAYNKWRF